MAGFVATLWQVAHSFHPDASLAFLNLPLIEDLVKCQKALVASEPVILNQIVINRLYDSCSKYHNSGDPTVTEMATKKIGMIGLGNMGSALARTILNG